MATLFTWILLNMVLPVCLGDRIVLSGSIALDPAKEEINFFLIPFYDLRLISHANCNSATGCYMQIDHPQHYNGTVDVQFSITFTKVVPSLAGAVTACKTIKGYQHQIPFVNRIYAHTCGSSYTARVLPSSPARTEWLEIALYTMFMDQRQYVSMINTNYTQVLVPQFSSTPRYTIHFYAAALHRRNPLFCGMYDSRGNRFFIRWLKRISPHLRVSTMDMWILDRDVIYKCSTYYYAADGTRVSVAREKTLSLKRIKVPSLTVLENLQIDKNFTATALLVVGSTTPVNRSMVTITRDGRRTDESILFHDYSSSHFHYFKLRFLMDGTTFGVYNVTARLSTEETFTQIIDVTKPNNITILRVSMTSSQVFVANGTVTYLECIVVTLNGKATVNWRRDEGEMSDFAIVEVDPKSNNTVQINRLKFVPVDYEDTGIYTCLANTSYLVSEIASLIVLPPGSPYFDPNYVDPDDIEITSSTPRAGTVASLPSPSPSLPSSTNYYWTIVASIGGGIFCAVVAIVISLVAIFRYRKWRKSRYQKVSNEDMVENNKDITDSADRLDEEEDSVEKNRVEGEAEDCDDYDDDEVNGAMYQ